MAEFRQREEERRKRGVVAYAEGEHEFLDALNDALLPLESTASSEHSEVLPAIWVLGLPRSGTTLLTQLIAFCLDVGYVNNLIARFWRAPLTGARLSQIVLRDFKHISYESQYGKSTSVSIPHEFSYFWHHWLKMENIPPYDPVAADRQIDWAGLRRTLLGMSAIFGKPMVHKALDVGYHVARFDERFEKSIFVYIERDPLDLAISFAKARLDYYANLDAWWSMYPVEHEQLVGRPYWEQIGGQIAFLSAMYRRQLAALPKGNVIDVSYGELCRDPRAVLDRIRARSRAMYDLDLPQIAAPPATFEHSRPTIDRDVTGKLRGGLATFGLV